MLVNLSHYGALQIKGVDAQKFLQGQLTCDVAQITAMQSRLGAHCNPQGRVISLFYLVCHEAAYYLLMQRSMIPIAMAALKKYSIFYKVEIRDVSEAWSSIGCQMQSIHDLPKRDHIVIIPLPSSSSRYLFFGPHEVIRNIGERLSASLSIQTPEVWKNLDIQEGLPTIYPETSGQFLPHELNLQHLNAVSFDKGCYTGQEIIARMHYRGQLKNHLYRARITTQDPIIPGQLIYTHPHEKLNTVGILVDAGLEAEHTYQVLLVTSDAHAENNELMLENKAQISLIR